MFWNVVNFETLPYSNGGFRSDIYDGIGPSNRRFKFPNKFTYYYEL